MKRSRVGILGTVGLAASLGQGSLAAEPCGQQLMMCMMDASSFESSFAGAAQAIQCRLDYYDCLYGYFIF
jgi:hypothetical protein